jgi:formylglycine-generating enzyme required for sulfatase activity
MRPKISVKPEGTVWTGTPGWESGREENEPALVEVAIPAPFGIGLYEVTRGQFAAFARATGRKPPASCLTDRRKRGAWVADAGASYLDVGFQQGDDHPAACVSFEDARDYVAWLNTQTSGGYRLPTEAEWEYAVRSNAHLLYAWSDEVLEACLYANVLDQSGGSALARKDGIGCDDGAVGTAPVGSHLPFVFFTYDMIGNVAEWVDGCAEPSSADGTCAGRIAKGGSWASSSSHLRPAARSVLSPSHHENTLGFRVAKSLGDPDAPLDSAAAYLRRGRIFSVLRDPRRALTDLERAVGLERSAATLAARGWDFYWADLPESARTDFEAALLLDAKNAPALAGLGS